jgi:hypothetical protein
MIHEAECHIVLEPGIGLFDVLKTAARPEPPIPHDSQIEEVFPDWRLRAKIFIGRCCEAEGKDFTSLTSQDIFRYGMKFMICESTKLI